MEKVKIEQWPCTFASGAKRANIDMIMTIEDIFQSDCAPVE